MFSLRHLRIKAMQYLFETLIHGVQEDLTLRDAVARIDESLQDAVHEVHATHAHVLGLINAWATLEEERAKLMVVRPSMPLANDPLLTTLRHEPYFVRLCKRFPLPFDASAVVKWYDGFTAKEQPVSKEQPTAYVVSMVKYLFKSKPFQEELSSRCLGWHEDQRVIYRRLQQFINSLAKTPEKAFECFTEELSTDRTAFYNTLLQQAFHARQAHQKLLEAVVSHWDVERIDLLDQVLIRLALTEIMFMPSIPPKVSINEYLEIAKVYSTPRSSAFINGVVDKIYKEVQDG